MSVKKLDRNFFQRLFGICATPKPQQEQSWKKVDEKITIDLNMMPELGSKGSAIRIEGKGVDIPVLVVHGDDGEYHAFENRCTHGKRALDPVPGTKTVQCCSIGTSTFNYDGTLVEGPGKGPLKVYEVSRMGETLSIVV
ncbi:(2Fe-2S)-binding protein [Prosthecochloris marina]|uniref:(2Fe-2S)-binding protein n=1 Tax=Prosthecochloris marina TaxID=2017681 RepID=A0A317T6C9_9CHLB|nr:MULTISPECIES: Rieske (2Fe-2S) protein [Prosthecochloris]PWW81026.1 (2Fe-2S)-binding protein [Prosthecochloris marina]